MIFNSLDFALFLPIVFALYWLIKPMGLKIQNGFILLASYFFYGWWDWRFLGLIALSSTVDYFCGLKMENLQDKASRKPYLYLSLAVNLSLLGFYKYFNFFVENFVNAFNLFGYGFEAYRLDIILPVGISFYTFQTLSYTIDIYKDRIKPTRDPLAFFGFVSFFPQLVAGPIERAGDLLPQFLKERKFEYDKAVDGMRQILWGLFKKMVIADNCAPYVYDIYQNAENLHSPVLIVGMSLFIGQLYCDFSGYSDIAIGSARLFGFNLSKNFNYPTFGTSIPDFWRRWHITLTNWFRDYVFMGLYKRRAPQWMRIRNIFILFIIIGFWHGATWNFIIFGLVNAILFTIQMRWSKRSSFRWSPENSVLQGIQLHSRILMNCLFVVLMCVFFRSETTAQAFMILSRTLNPNNFFVLDIIPAHNLSLKVVSIMAFSVIYIFEWFSQGQEYGLEMKNKIYRFWPVRWSIYFLIIFVIYHLRGVEQDFIYFQF